VRVALLTVVMISTGGCYVQNPNPDPSPSHYRNPGQPVHAISPRSPGYAPGYYAAPAYAEPAYGPSRYGTYGAPPPAPTAPPPPPPPPAAGPADYGDAAGPPVVEHDPSMEVPTTP
jgi:hypothetical protein